MDSYIHKILSLNKHNEKHTYQLSENFLVSVLNTEQSLLLCLHTGDISLHKAFHFLITFKTNLLSRTLGLLDKIDARSLTAIESDLEDLILTYNLNQPLTGLEVLREELKNINNLMIENLEKLEERSQKIEVLKEKMRGLALASGYNFRKDRKKISTDEETQATSKKKKSRKGLWICLMSLFAMLTLGFILTIYICGGYSFDKC